MRPTSTMSGRAAPTPACRTHPRTQTSRSADTLPITSHQPALRQRPPPRHFRQALCSDSPGRGQPEPGLRYLRAEGASHHPPGSPQAATLATAVLVASEFAAWTLVRAQQPGSRFARDSNGRSSRVRDRPAIPFAAPGSCPRRKARRLPGRRCNSAVRRTMNLGSDRERRTLFPRRAMRRSVVRARWDA